MWLRFVFFFFFNSRFFLLDPQVAERELVEASVRLQNILTLSEEPQLFCLGSSKDFQSNFSVRWH